MSLSKLYNAATIRKRINKDCEYDSLLKSMNQCTAAHQYIERLTFDAAFEECERLEILWIRNDLNVCRSKQDHCNAGELVWLRAGRRIVWAK